MPIHWLFSASIRFHLTWAVSVAIGFHCCIQTPWYHSSAVQFGLTWTTLVLSTQPNSCLFTDYLLPIHCQHLFSTTSRLYWGDSCRVSMGFHSSLQVPMPSLNISLYSLDLCDPLPIYCVIALPSKMFTAHSLRMHSLFTVYSLPIHCQHRLSTDSRLYWGRRLPVLPSDFIPLCRSHDITGRLHPLHSDHLFNAHSLLFYWQHPPSSNCSCRYCHWISFLCSNSMISLILSTVWTRLNHACA
jgi:hypothetical protein